MQLILTIASKKSVSVTNLFTNIIYYIARYFLFLLGVIPIPLLAHIGRFIGRIAYIIDKRHREVAQNNLRLIFGKELSEEKIHQLAKENYLRVVEAYFSAIGTLQMDEKQLKKRLTIKHFEYFFHSANDPAYGPSRIALIGHFGNFELYAKATEYLPRYQFATTYRGFDNKIADQLLHALRSKSSCLFFERRKDGVALKKAMNSSSLLLGFLADQHPGDKGIWLPFMGVECRCSTSAAVFALRYNSPVIPVFCFRVAPGKWEIEFDKEIPTKSLDGTPRTIKDIMIDINASYERAIRRDPANWFWVHRRWKSYYRYLESQKNSNE